MDFLRKKYLNHSDYQAYCKSWAEIANILAFGNQLTKRETDALGAFLAVDKGDLRGLAFKTTGRQIVRERLGLSHQNLSNLLDRLKKKKAIKEDGKLGYLFHPAFELPGNSGTVEIIMNYAEKEKPSR